MKLIKRFTCEDELVTIQKDGLPIRTKLFNIYWRIQAPPTVR